MECVACKHTSEMQYWQTNEDGVEYQCQKCGAINKVGN
jgi:Zn ribbon nucleic-acid-binding protein